MLYIKRHSKKIGLFCLGILCLSLIPLLVIDDHDHDHEHEHLQEELLHELAVLEQDKAARIQDQLEQEQELAAIVQEQLEHAQEIQAELLQEKLEQKLEEVELIQEQFESEIREEFEVVKEAEVEGAFFSQSGESFVVEGTENNFFATPNKREIQVYIHDFDHHRHYRSSERTDLISILSEGMEEKVSMELEGDQAWYKFNIPAIPGGPLSLEFKGQNYDLLLPPGHEPLFISVMSEDLFPTGVKVWTQEDIVKGIRLHKTEIKGKIPIHNLTRKDIPRKILLHLPFTNWEKSTKEFDAPFDADIDWMNARFTFKVKPIFTTIAFIQIGETYFPLYISPHDFYRLEWKADEENPLHLSMVDAERQHYHGIRAQDFLNIRYPNGMNQKAYKDLVKALNGKQDQRLDTLIAWSRAIVPLFEEKHSNPEQFLTHLNQIGNLSWQDAFVEAYETENSRIRDRDYDSWSDITGFLVFGTLLSFLLFAYGIYAKNKGYVFFQKKNLEKIEVIFMGFLSLLLANDLLVNGQHSYIKVASPAEWILFFGVIALFYVNWRFLCDRFLLKRRWGKYLLSLLALSAVFLVFALFQDINPLSEYTLAFFDGNWHGLDNHNNGPGIEIAGGVYLISLVVAPMYAGLRHILLNGFPKLRAQKEALNAELKTLKTQISPHFFFNSLNTVYSFALTEESPKTAEAITKLSDLMRFAIYQGDQKLIPLETELEYLSDYIDMQRLRLNPIKHDLRYRVDGEAGNLQIAPLLLITLIENAFKHGISMSKDSYIHVDLFILDQGLILTVENSVHPKEMVMAGGKGLLEEGGVGLVNTQERLNLLYSRRHEWRIEEEDHRYFTQLSLDLAD